MNHLAVGYKGYEEVYLNLKKLYQMESQKECIKQYCLIVFLALKMCKSKIEVKYIETSNRLEKMGIDILEIRNEYVLVTTDYISQKKLGPVG